jgi:hypothetical protein
MSYLHFRKIWATIRREVLLCIIVIEFVTALKLVPLIKLRLKETYKESMQENLFHVYFLLKVAERCFCCQYCSTYIQNEDRVEMGGTH